MICRFQLLVRLTKFGRKSAEIIVRSLSSVKKTESAKLMLFESTRSTSLYSGLSITFILQACCWFTYGIGTFRHGDKFRPVFLQNFIDLLQRKREFYLNPPTFDVEQEETKKDASWFGSIISYDHKEDPKLYPALSYLAFFMASGCLTAAIFLPSKVIKRIYVYKPMSSMFRGGNSSTEVASELTSDLGIEPSTKLLFETYGLLSLIPKSLTAQVRDLYFLPSKATTPQFSIVHTKSHSSTKDYQLLKINRTFTNYVLDYSKSKIIYPKAFAKLRSFSV